MAGYGLYVEDNGCPSLYWPLGLKPEDGERLMNCGHEYRFINGARRAIAGYEATNIYIIDLSKEDADELGVEYFSGEWWKLDPEAFPMNVLGDDNIVHVVSKLYKKKTTFRDENEFAVHVVRYYAMGYTCMGFFEAGVGYLAHSMSALLLSGRYPKLMNIKFPVRGFKEDEPYTDPRIAAFIDILLKTGDIYHATRIAYNVWTLDHIERKFGILMRNPEVQMAIKSRTEELVEKALREKGLHDSPQEWLVNKLLTAIEEFDDLKPSAQVLVGKVNTIEKMLDRITKEKEPPASRRLLPLNGEFEVVDEASGALPAEEIKRLKGSHERSNKKELPDKNVIESDGDRKSLSANNVQSEESSISSGDV
jgi:hypothetical protein